LRSKSAAIPQGRDNILEVRLVESLHKERFALGSFPECQLLDVPLCVLVYYGSAGVIVEIVKRLQTIFRKELLPAICKKDPINYYPFSRNPLFVLQLS
jgi:hypothetical protein